MATFDAGSIEGTLDLDLNPFNVGLDEALARLDEEFDGKTFSANLGLDTKGFASELDKAKAMLDEFKKMAATATAKVNVDRKMFDELVFDLKIFGLMTYTAKAKVDTSGNLELDVLLAKLAALHDERVEVRVNTSESGGIGGSGGMGSIQTIIMAVIFLLPVLASALGAAIGLVGALGSAFVIAGIGAAGLMAVAIPALNEITKAAKKGQAGIDALPPALRGAGNAFLGLQKTIADLQAAGGFAVGNLLAAGFNLASDVLRSLQPVILATAAAFTQAIGIANSFFKSPDWVSFTQFLVTAMSPVVKDLTTAFFALFGSLINLTKAFYDLGGSKILDMIVSSLQEFDKWTSKLGENPAFKEFMDSIIKDIPPVMDFLGQLVVFILHLIEALSPLGNMILGVVDAILHFVNSLPPGLLGPLTLGLIALALSITGIGGAASAIIVGVMALAAGLAYLYDHSKPLQDAMKSMGDMLNDWFQPAWKKIVDLWNQYVIPAWNDLVAVFNDPQFKQGAQDLANLVKDKLLPAFEKMADTFVKDVIPGFLHFMAAAAPIIAWIGDLVAGNLIGQASRLFLMLSGGLEVLGGVLQLVADLLKGNFSGAWQDILNILHGVADFILGAFGTSWDELWKNIQDGLATVGQWFSDRWNDITTFLSETWQKIKDKASEIWGGISDFFKGIWQGVKDTAQSVWDSIVEYFTTKWQGIKDTATLIWDSIKEFFTQKFTEIKDNITGIWDAITDYFTRLFQKHHELIEQVWNAISTFFTEKWNFIRDTAVGIWDAISEFFSTKWKETSDTWNMIWTNVSQFFQDTWNTIHTWITDKWNTISTWFSDRWAELSQKWNDFWTAVQNFFINLWNYIHDWIVSKWTDISTWLSGKWDELKAKWDTFWQGVQDKVTAIWNYVVDWLKSKWQEIVDYYGPKWDALKSQWDGFWQGVSDTFTRIWDGIKSTATTVWDGIVGAIKTGVNTAIDAINGLIGDAHSGIDWVLDFFLIPLIPKIPKLESGGVISDGVQMLASGGSVGGGFMTSGPRAIVGEGNPAYPEYVIPTDPAYRKNAMSLFADLGTKMLASGGVVPAVAGAASGGTPSFFADPIGFITGLVSDAKNAAGKLPIIKDIASGGIDKFVGAVTQKVKDAIAAAAQAALALIGLGGPATAGGDLMAWIAQAEALTGVGSSWTSGLVTLIMRESGGNPNAINLTDSNARAGHPSQGLMQTIPGTFAAYHQPGTSNSITDPVANIAAGINYIKARYGGIGNVQQANPNLPPKGYDAGGYLPTGMTLAINRTGKPERVLDAAQTAKFDAAMTGGGTDNSLIADKLDAVKQLLEKNGAGAVINVHDASGDPTETARRAVLALRMG